MKKKREVWWGEKLHKSVEWKNTVKAAFPVTIPVMTGYLFMGAAFGIYLNAEGFNAIWAFLMGLTIYAGSGQFVAVSLLAAGFNPWLAIQMTLMVNARHVFYGISMLERFKKYGRAKWYLIFAMTDETFALLISAKPPKGISEKNFSIAIAVLDHLYWIVGCTFGALLGSALPINPLGIDFVMTALFIVIFLEQWQQRRNRTPALIGIGISLLCRLIFGSDAFIMAAMVVLVLIFTLGRKPLEKGWEGQ